MALLRRLVGRWGPGVDEVDDVIMDAVSNSLVVMDNAHHEIHEEDSYRVFINKDVGNAGTFAIAFTTPNTAKWVNLTFAVSHELEGDFKLYEAITSWTSGTPITPVNANRTSSNTSGITDMVFDPSVTLGTPVTLIHEVGGSGRQFGSASDHDTEWILAENTTYLLLFTNLTANSNETNLQLDWYEHTADHT